MGERGHGGESEELQILTRELMRLTGLNTNELNTTCKDASIHYIMKKVNVWNNAKCLI